jgi:hypothetical protein
MRRRNQIRRHRRQYEALPGRTRITEQDLRRGDRVVIDATNRGEILEAIEIRVNDLSSPEQAH